MGESVHFDIHERRVLGLPLKGDINDETAVALRKILDTFPLVKDVAECNFDPNITEHALIVMANAAAFRERCRMYHEQKAQPKPDQEAKEK